MNKVKHNQPLFFGNRFRDQTLEEIAAYTRAVKNIGKIVTVTLAGDSNAIAVSEGGGWIIPVSGGFDPVNLANLMRKATTAHKRQQQIGWA